MGKIPQVGLSMQSSHPVIIKKTKKTKNTCQVLIAFNSLLTRENFLFHNRVVFHRLVSFFVLDPDSVSGVSICTSSAGMMTKCQIVQFTKASRRSMSGLPVMFADIYAALQCIFNNIQHPPCSKKSLAEKPCFVIAA